MKQTRKLTSQKTEKFFVSEEESFIGSATGM